MSVQKARVQLFDTKCAAQQGKEKKKSLFFAADDDDAVDIIAHWNSVDSTMSPDGVENRKKEVEGGGGGGGGGISIHKRNGKNIMTGRRERERESKNCSVSDCPSVVRPAWPVLPYRA